MAETERSRLLARALLVAGLVVGLDQTGQLIEAITPMLPGAPQWRFASVGAASLRFSGFLMADLLLLAGLHLLGSRGWQRFLGVVHLLIALATAGVIASFALDALEVRHAVRQELVPGITAGSIRVGAMLGLLLLFCLWIGVQLLRRPSERVRRTEEAERSLIVGTQGAGERNL